jgi:integrase/recombinase XerC
MALTLDSPKRGVNTAQMIKGNANLIDLFLAYLVLRGMSEHTIRRRRSSLRGFERWLRPCPIGNAERDHVEGWLATFREARTRHAYHSDLSAFYQWAIKRRAITHNPVLETDSIRVPKGLPRPVPPSAVPAIINAAPTERLRLALMLAAYAGLRRAEITAVTGRDIQIHPTPTLVVRAGKGNKDRLVPLHPALAFELSEFRGTGRLVPLSADRVGRLAADHMRSLGYNCTIHQLRASFATEAARVLDGNIVAVGKMLGHESPQTTMGYCGWGGGDVAARMAAIYAA